MNSLKQILFFAFVFVSLQSFAQNKQTITIKTPNTCDHCKVCETCGGLLEKELVYVKGIQLVTYDEESQTTKVIYRSKKITPEQIRKEIALLGFNADDVKADPNGYKKRDDCCKGGE